MTKNVILEKHLNLMNYRLAHEHLFLVVRDLFNDIHNENLCFTQFSTRLNLNIGLWPVLTFFICLHNQLSSIQSIDTY